MTRPQYLDIPYESPARIGSNGVPLPPLAGGPAVPPSPDVPPTPAPKESAEDAYKGWADRVRAAPDKPAPFRMVEEKPVSPETTEALLGAIHKVFRVATARIKYHEAEAARLRAALAPFGNLAGPGGGPSAPPSAETAITSLIEAVRMLPELESGHAEASQS